MAQILIWKRKGAYYETECGRFYIMRALFGVYRLYDSRNRSAGGVACDSKEEAMELAARIAGIK